VSFSPAPGTGHLPPDEWQGQVTPYPLVHTVHSLFREQAARRPDAIAVQDGEACLTYRELDERANQLAHYLRERGVQPDQPVAVCMDRSIEFVIAVLAILKAGGAYVPFSPDLPPRRIQFIIEDVAPLLLITHRNRLTDMAVPGLAVLRFDADESACALYPATPPTETASPAGLACILFTSGSTGRPKGVEIIHRGIAQLLFGTDYVPFTAEQVFILLASVSFDASLLELWGPLLHGARCVVYSDTELDFRRLGNLIRESGVSCMWLTSTLFNSLVDLDPALLEGVSHLMTGGEALSVPHVRKALDALPSTLLINGYGPAECTVFTSTYTVPRDFPADAKSVPIGKPIANTRVYILDPHMQPVPVGEPGELYVGKDNLARGYHGRPDLTAECFLPDPFRGDPEARIYKSGDRCRWLPGGNIEFLRRFDSQVKVRGFRIELAEIECILGRHPSILQSAVCAYGESNARRLAAFVKLAAAAPCSEAALRNHLREYLPGYMVPGLFLFPDAFPLTPSGKIDRQTLPEMAWAAAVAVSSNVEPETDTERTLAMIWAGVFGLEHVGVEDDFFDLGGDSLKAASVLVRVSQVCRVDLKHRHLFDMPSIRRLARYIDKLPETERGGFSEAIERHKGEASAPLSFEQEEVWLALQVHTDEPLFNEPFTLRITGTVDPATLQDALNALAVRHEVFRTGIVVKDGTPVQVVSDRVAVPFRFTDMRDVPPEEREAKAMSAATAETRREFRLGQPPLLRALLVQLDENDSRLYLIMHHIITDAWTFYDVIIPELRVLYEGILEGAAPSLGDPPVQYTDYARWQRGRLRGPAVEKRLATWRERFQGAQALALTPDRHRPSGSSCRGASQFATLPAELAGVLRDLARQENATLFMVLLTGFKVLLSRYTQQDDIVVGTAMDCRNAPELETAAGCFVRAVPVRTDTGGNPTFRELLRRIRDVMLETYDLKDVPFAELSEALQTPGSPSRQDLLKVTCVMEPGVPVPPTGWAGWQVEIQTGTAKFDLLFELEERDGGVLVRAERNADLYEAATMDRMLSHLDHLLRCAAAAPETRLEDLPLQPEAESRSLVRDLAGTPRPYPRGDTVHGLFARQAARRGNAAAVVDGSTTLSYRELNSRANQLAHYLCGRGVAPGDAVALCMARTWEYIVAVLGVLKAGAAYVPIEPGLPARRMEFLLSDAGASIMVGHRDCGSHMALPGVAVLRLEEIGAEVSRQPDAGLPDTTTAESLAYIMFTSGSTGEPKGVEIPHRGIVRLVCGTDYIPFDEGITSLLLAPLGFDASTFELWAPLLNGGRCVVYPRPETDLAELERVINESRVTCLWLTAGLFNSIIDLRPRLLATVTHVLTGGEALSVSHVRRALALLPDTHIINGYGPTENTTFSCTYAIPSTVPEHAPSVPIGQPIANTRAYILDPNGQPVPVAVPGELHVGGDGLARGYRNHPQLTAERFVPDPFVEESGARMYKTGDRCRWLPNGNIEFLGRFDHQVKLRGFRIEPGEIEAVLSQHPEVTQCAVAVRGEGDARRMVAYVTPVSGSNCPLGGLRAHLAERLPSYMVPGRLVCLDTMPLTPNGKIDRNALPDPSEPQHEYAPPRTETERALVRIWGDAFAADCIGVEDDFFELGGHSLKALTIAAAIERQFGRAISLARFFTAPTIAQLAAALDEGSRPETSGKAIHIAGSGALAPLFCIPGAGGTVFSFRKLAMAAGKSRPVYGLQYPGLGDDEVPLDSLEAVAEELARRILEAEPRGPYNLLGYSLGGYVSFEIARKLRAMGHRVAMLGMIDCIAPNALAQRPLLERVRMHLAQWRRAGGGARLRYVIDRLRHRLASGKGHEPLVPEEESGLSAENLRHVQAHMEQAAEQYKPEPYSGRIVLFRAVQPDWIQFTVMDECMGWEPYVRGGMEVHAVPGLHLDVLKDPNVDKMASVLEQCLASASSEADWGDPSPGP
jgi:amino acid adenylation domain-containing protein